MSNLFFLKFVARDSIQRTHVIFCAVANKQKNSIEKFEALVSYSPELININTDFTYKDVVSKIQKFMLDGNYVQNATLSLVNTFKNSFATESFLMEIIYYLEYDNMDKLNELLKQNLSKILGKNDVYINSAFLAIEREDIDKSSQDIQAQNSNSIKDEISEISELSLVPAGSILSNFTFVLSPVHGTRADELKVSDRVMVKIPNDNEVSNNVINLLSLKDDGGIVRPAPATIIDIKKQTNEISYIVKLTDGIFAKYVESEIAVRVKLAGNETLVTNSKNIEEFEIHDHHSKSEGFSLNLNTILIGGVLLFIIISWIIVSILL